MSCHTNTGKKEHYAYDIQGRLTEIRNHSGLIILRNVYDDFGNLVTDSNDIVMTDPGKKIWRSFSNNRLISAKDESGSTLNIKYGTKNELSSLEIKVHSGKEWKLFYDNKGNLTKFQNPFGEITELSFDQSGKVMKISYPNRKTCSFKQDKEGQLVILEDNNGRQKTFKHDNNGLLLNVFGPNNDVWDFDYVNNLPSRIYGPKGEVRILPRKKYLNSKSFCIKWNMVQKYF